MRKKLLLVAILSAMFLNLHSQINVDQNGLKTFVTNTLYANATQAKRYEIASVAYNSYHWQHGGIIIIELYEEYFQTGYEKYIIENGFGQGANSGSPVLKLIESRGIDHSAKLTLGSAIDLSSSYAGWVNRALPIFLDIRYYAGYKARITYVQDKVDEFSSLNQIKINENPTSIDIPDFSVSTEIVNDKDIISAGNLRITGNGNHFIQNGNVGIGTTSPQNKLDVNGTIHAKEVKVDLTGWSDFVFAPAYKLKTLAEVEQYIKKNNHLPEIPSAKEVEQNGVSLGDMQAKLLQKVEELTLYSIEQDKKLQEQEKKLQEEQQLKAKVEEQSEKLQEQGQENAEMQLKLAKQEQELKELKELVMKKLK